MDDSRAPTLLSGDMTASTYRYWLTGEFAEGGDVTLNFLSDSWAFNTDATGSAVVEIVLGEPTAFLTVAFPDPDPGMEIVEASILDADLEISLALQVGDWTVTLSPDAVPIKISDTLYTYALDVSDAPSGRHTSRA